MVMFTIATVKPSYGELIDMLNAAESEADKSRDTHAKTLLLDKFRQKYKHVSISRPERFYDTVCRIAAPTRPSLKGTSKLQGSPLVTYRRRIWVPKNTREKAGIYIASNMYVCILATLYINYKTVNIAIAICYMQLQCN